MTPMPLMGITRPINGAMHMRPACYATASATPHNSDLLTWFQKLGGYVHPALQLLPSQSSGFGLIATLPISSGTPLIGLPPHLPLSMPSPQNVLPNSPHAALLDLASSVPEDLWSLRLGLKLLMERAQKDSFWWPYISNLPQRFNTPIFFSGEEITGLQYIPVVHQVKKRCRVLLELARTVESVLRKLPADQQPFGGQEVTASALGWAMAAVSSRAFHMHKPKNYIKELPGGHRVMLPLVDMCNHSFTPNASIVQQEKEKEASLIVLAENSLQAGTDIFLSYGSLSNDVLLLDYGFIVPQNPYDHVELKYDNMLLEAARVAASSHSANFTCPAPWQQSFLEGLNLQGPGASLQVKVGGPDLIDGRLLAALRILYTQDADNLGNRDLSLLQAWDPVAPLGVENEKNVLRTLVAVCALALGHFPTTIAEDELILANKELSVASRLVLEYRMAKKQLLVDVMRNITQKLNLLGTCGK